MLRKWKQFAVKQSLSVLPSRLALRLCKGRPRFARQLPVGSRLEMADYLGEFKVYLDTTFPVEREMVSGLYDHRTLAVIRQQVKPGDTCIDIGANVGALTLALAQCVGSSGTVLAIEPGTPNWKKLQKNIQANPHIAGVVQSYQVGLGSKEGYLHWQEEASNRGNAFLVSHGGTEQVRVTTLDQLIESCPHIEKIDFIKMDVEGMELDVLRGATRTVREYQPKIFFESQKVWRKRLGADHFQAIEQFFRDHGYDLLRLNRDGSLTPTSIQETSSNTLAVPARSHTAQKLAPSRG